MFVLSSSSDYRHFYIRAARQLYGGQKIPELQGLRSVIGGKKVLDPHTRRTNSARFKFCSSDSLKTNSIAHVCGPLAILNGACVNHANCETDSFEVVKVGPSLVEKHEELTLVYNEDEPIDVPGAQISGLRCGYKGCREIIMQ